MITQARFNELVYFALQIHMAELKSLGWSRGFQPNGSYGDISSQNTSDKVITSFAQRLFCARFHSIENSSISSHLHYRFKHFVSLLTNFAENIKDITHSVQDRDLRASVLDCLAITAQSQDDTARVEDEIPLSIVMDTLYAQRHFMPKRSLLDNEYLTLFNEYKLAVMAKLNRHFDCNFDYTYLGSEKPWLIQHFYEIYGAELFITTAVTVALYLFNPLSSLARVAMIDVPLLHLGVDASEIIPYTILEKPLPMPDKKQYLFNPHRHTKIWLSKDENVFLNQENQLRLINMRVINPEDTINFIYAKELLSEDAQRNLIKFCKIHRINPVSIEEEIIPLCAGNANEEKLIELYQQEIRQLTGGNLAAASDMLRWLKPVYSQGTYSDFDVPVNTRDAPAEKVVDAPMLLNMGSARYTDDGIESLMINNDVISIVDANDAFEMISRIQTSIIESSISSKRFTDSLNKIIEKASKSNRLDFEVQTPDFILLSFLSYIELNLTTEINLPDFRSKLIELTNSNESFLELLSQINDKPLENIRADLLHNQTFPYNEDEIITTARKEYQEQFIKLSVMYITGPVALYSVFEPYSTWDKINQNKQYAYSNYGLNAVFLSNNSANFHSTKQDILKKLFKQNAKTNDASWLESGQARIQNQEKAFNTSARTLQRFFRGVSQSQKENKEYAKRPPRAEC